MVSAATCHVKPSVKMLNLNYKKGQTLPRYNFLFITPPSLTLTGLRKIDDMKIPLVYTIGVCVNTAAQTEPK